MRSQCDRPTRQVNTMPEPQDQKHHRSSKPVNTHYLGEVHIGTLLTRTRPFPRARPGADRPPAGIAEPSKLPFHQERGIHLEPSTTTGRGSGSRGRRLLLAKNSAWAGVGPIYGPPCLHPEQPTPFAPARSPAPQESRAGILVEEEPLIRDKSPGDARPAGG